MNPAAMKYWKDYYGQLVGSKITGFKMVKGDYDDEPYPPFFVSTRSGCKLKLELSMDPEGNGPGFLFISETEIKKEKSC